MVTTFFTRLKSWDFFFYFLIFRFLFYSSGRKKGSNCTQKTTQLKPVTTSCLNKFFPSSLILLSPCQFNKQKRIWWHWFFFLIYSSIRGQIHFFEKLKKWTFSAAQCSSWIENGTGIIQQSEEITKDTDFFLTILAIKLFHATILWTPNPAA